MHRTLEVSKLTMSAASKEESLIESSTALMITCVGTDLGAKKTLRSLDNKELSVLESLCEDYLMMNRRLGV